MELQRHACWSRPAATATPTLAVYKPERGERPLWDFPRGLFRREVAAYAAVGGAGLGARAADGRARGPATARARSSSSSTPTSSSTTSPCCEDARHHDQLRAHLRVRRPRQQRRPQERPLPAGARRHHLRRSTTACASTSSPSCAPSSGTSPASRCPRRSSMTSSAWSPGRCRPPCARSSPPRNARSSSSAPAPWRSRAGSRPTPSAAATPGRLV